MHSQSTEKSIVEMMVLFGDGIESASSKPQIRLHNPQENLPHACVLIFQLYKFAILFMSNVN